MENYKYTNRLIEETSPYLLEHAHQPVNWYPWCDEALKRAKDENKLLFISVGYSACHWCHAMAKESFSNELIALILNKYFISIKVDKEERPDLDQIYLNAIRLLTNNAGWPLNCFALPDGTPIFGGTYFNPEQFLDIVQSLQDTYTEDKQNVLEVAEGMRESLMNIDVITEKEKTIKFTRNDIRLIIEPWRRKFDNINGGTENPPKFPLPNGKEFLLNAAYYFEDEEIKQHLEITLDKMAQGAIYDQLEGGFSRYTVDKEWRLPHFEMMLYDNAQLISLYSKSYRYLKKELYKTVIEQTIDFLQLRMRSNDGAYYCSVDSDSDGSEGRYYLWTWQEWCSVLKDDAEFAANYFGVTEQGNYSNGLNILYVAVDEVNYAEAYEMSLEELHSKINSIKQLLYTARDKQAFPKVDKKIIASWNGMMITGLLEAYIALGNEKYLDEAKKIADYIRKKLMYNNNCCVYRTVTSKNPIKGFLDDYAFIINAFITLYRVSFDESYLHDAKSMTDYVIAHFYDERSGMFFYTSDEEETPISRKMDFVDKATSSSCSEMTLNLLLISIAYNDKSYIEITKQMLANIKTQMAGAGPFIANWAKLLFYFVYHPIFIWVTKDKMNEVVHKANHLFSPNMIIFPAKSDGNKSTIKYKVGNIEKEVDNIDTVIEIAQKTKAMARVRALDL